MRKSSIVLFILASCLSACASHYASTGDKVYLRSKNGPMLVVPPPLNSGNVSSFYVLPHATPNPKISILPPDDIAHQPNKKG